MSLQDSVRDSRVEYDSCINEPSVDNDTHITLAINPPEYYNKWFSDGENGQYSDNQTENPVKEWGQKSDFPQRDKDVHTNSLQVGLVHSNEAENNDTGKGIPNGHKLICIPLKVDGSMSLGPCEDNGVNRGYTDCHDDASKFTLTTQGPQENKTQNSMSNYYSSKKIDGEAIVDLASNKHNRCNRILHDYLWCPFVLFFVFFCCAPAILLMHKSDIAFQKGRDSEARRWALCSSLLYGLGLVFTLAFYAMIFALVFIFAKYELY